MSGAVASPAVTPILRRRLRALTFLGVATAIAVLLAILAVWMRSSSVAPDFADRLMFPSLEAKAQDVATILVESKTSAFSVTRDAQGRWVLPGKSGHPADVNQIRKTVIALSQLELVDQRTARADWHERLGVSLPKGGGSGVVVTLKDSRGNVLANLVSGQAVEGAAAGGKTAHYVRRPDENQTYVALGTYVAQPDQTQWLDKTYLDFRRDRIKTVAVKPLKGPSYSVTRAKPADEKFSLVEQLPRGRVLRTEAEPNGVGHGLIGISFEDVARADTMDFSHAARTTYLTFDGLSVTVNAVEKDRDFWITLNATAAPQAPAPAPTTPPAPGAPPAPATPKADVAKEAGDINRMAGGWAYKIPRYKGVLITAALEDLLKPIGSPPPGPDPTAPQ